MDHIEKLRRARIVLIKSTELRIFGCILYRFDIIFVENDPELSAAVTIIKNKPTILLSPAFISKCDIRQIIFVLLHEILHVVDGHLRIAFGLDMSIINRKIANIAQDHCINKMLVADSKNSLKTILSPPDVDYVLFQEIIHENWPWEEVYTWLMDNKVTKITVSEDGKSVTIDGVKYDLDISNGDGSEDGDGDKNDPGIADKISKDLQSIIRSVIDNDSGNSRGTTNSEIFEHLNKITKITLPWNTLLEKVIARHVTPSNENRTWKSYNKFLRQYALLPAFDNDVVYTTLYVVIDTSASVGSKDLEKFAGVIENSLTLFQQVRIIHHSVDVTFNKLYTTEELLTNNALLLEVYGRGSTSHTDCFDLIESSYLEDNVEFVIFLTDFESNVESIWNKYEWHTDVPCKFVLNQNIAIPQHIDDSPIIIDKYINK